MTDLLDRLYGSRLPRRTIIAGAALLALAPGLVLAQQPSGDATADKAAEIMKPGPRGDLVMGKADAPVTIIEYASMTCSHCASFHNVMLPQLKQKYIDTGKARLVLREFPLDNLAAAGSMLARCAGSDEKAFDMVSALFKQQDQWVIDGNPVPVLFKIAQEQGFTKESFDKCLTDQALLDDITSARDKASKTFGVRSTPTFFINGKKLEGRSDQLTSFDAAIEPLLAK